MLQFDFEKFINYMLDYIEFSNCPKCDELLYRFSLDRSCDYCCAN